MNAAAAAAVTKVTRGKPFKYFAHKQNVLLQPPPDYKAARIGTKTKFQNASPLLTQQC